MVSGRVDVELQAVVGDVVAAVAEPREVRVAQSDRARGPLDPARAAAAEESQGEGEQQRVREVRRRAGYG